MKINEVEDIVGISKKNIRFYEDQGLISPKRNPENKYREYSEDDVRKLSTIKLLRKLRIPIDVISELLSGKIDLNDCLKTHSVSLEQESKSLTIISDMCLKIVQSSYDIEDLDVSSYLDEIQLMESKGVRFMDVKNKDIKQKKTSTLLAFAVMLTVFMFIGGIIIWASREDPIPLAFLIFILAIVSALIIGLFIALKQRFEEINGGEEDAAGKY